MIRHGGVPFSCQQPFELGQHVTGESWGHHHSGNDRTELWSSRDFRMGPLIGKGGFGNVYRAQICRPTVGQRGKQEIALKKISKKTVMEREKRGRRALLLLRRETNIQSRLNHQHIIRLYGFFETSTSFTLVLELGNRGDVFNYLKETDKRGDLVESFIRRVLVQTSRALAYLEQSLIAHRDIKPENIILDDNLDAKLADFGWAVFCRPSQWQHTFCGTAEYCPPEIATKGEINYDPRFVDRWMLGILIIELILGATPFQPQDADDDYSDAMALAMVNAFDSVDKFKLPQDIKDLVSELLVVDPLRRKSAHWVSIHPFFGVNEIPPVASPMVAHRRQLFQSEGYR